MRVARQVRQDGFWTGEGFLGVDNPVDFAQWGEEIVKDGIVDETRMITEELQFPSFVQLGQPFQNETLIQKGQNPDGEEEVLAAGDPLCAISRQAAARHDHVDVRVMGHGGTPGVENRGHARLEHQGAWGRRQS